MIGRPKTLEEAIKQIDELCLQLEEAEETIQAIQTGQVDAVVISGPEGEQIYTLTGAERAYRILVEAMNEGALVLSPDGIITYSNRTFASMLGVPVYEALGHSIFEFVADADLEPLKRMLEQALTRNAKREIELKHNDAGPVPALISVGSLETGEEPSVSAVVTDLTEHKRTEAELEKYREHLEELVQERTRELAESRQKVFSILESISDGFLTFDADWRLVYMNSEGERQMRMLTGRAKGEILGRNIWEEFPGMTGTEVFSKLCRAAQEHTPVVLQQFHPQSGRWFELRAFPSPDGLSVYSEDITDRKQAEEALRESEERFRALFEYSPDAVFLTVPEGIIKAANPAACEMFGMTEEEICRTGRAGLIDPDDSRQVVLAEERKRTGRVVNLETNYIRKNGEKFTAETSSVILPGDSPRAFVILHDITERKQAEEDASQARAEAEGRLAQLESLISSMGDGVLLFDTESGIVMLNDAQRQLFGLPADIPFWDVVEQYEIRTLDGKSMPREDYPSARALKGEKTRDVRLTLVTPWRESVVSVSASPVLDPEGRITGATVSSRDMADRVEFERRQQELYERERRISQMLQQALIPPQIPSTLKELSIAARYQPALKEAEIGGDFYDIFELDDNKVGVLIGDVVGKGLTAAIRVAAARYAVRSYAYLDPSPSRVMTLVNDALCRECTDTSNILTAFYAVVDTSNGTMVYASAGHEPPVVCNSCGEVEELCVTGAMLGVIPGAKYREYSRNLRRGDNFVMFTDGITEARHDAAILFDKEGVIEHLKRACDAQPEEIAEALLQAATLHAGGSLQDDAAIVVMSF